MHTEVTEPSLTSACPLFVLYCWANCFLIKTT